MNLSAFIRGRVVPRLYSTCGRVVAIPKEAGLDQASLETPDGVGDLLGSLAEAAVTLNGSLDYFVQTVNIAARVQNLSDAKEICVTSEVLTAPGVKDILASNPIRQETAQLKGVHQQIPVFRITAVQT